MTFVEISTRKDVGLLDARKFMPMRITPESLSAKDSLLHSFKTSMTGMFSAADCETFFSIVTVVMLQCRSRSFLILD